MRAISVLSLETGTSTRWCLAAAAAAAIAYAHLEFRLLERLGDFCCACHLLRHSFFAKRKPERLEQLAALLVVLRAGGHGDVHALDLIHARVIDLRKHQLVFQPQSVIPAAVERILRQAAEVAHARKHHVTKRSRNSYM